MEADGLGEAADIGFVGGEEAPTGFGDGAGVFHVVVGFEVFDFFGVGKGGGFLGVEADGPDVVVVADGLGDHLGGGKEVVEDEGAEHGAFEVDEGEDDGFASLEFADRDGVALFVVEGDVGRDGGAEVLGDADVLEEGGGGLGASEQSGEEEGQGDKETR